MLENQYQEQGSAGQRARSALAERRAAARVPVIKSGKLIVGGEVSQSVLNCLVLDESRSGVLIDLGAVFTLPEEMTLNMSSGASHRVRKRWAVGTKAGLEFTGGQLLGADAAQQMSRMAELLRLQGLPATVAALRVQNYYAYEPLRAAAEAAVAAYEKLEQVLNQKV